MQNQFSEFFALFKIAQNQGCNATREELVYEFTKGAKNALKSLTGCEYRELIYQLRCRVGQKARYTPRATNDPVRDKMRKAIIAQFYVVGKTAKDAIAWAEKYGYNGNKRKFSDYSAQELKVLIQMAEKMKDDFLKRVRTV